MGLKEKKNFSAEDENVGNELGISFASQAHSLSVHKKQAAAFLK